MMGNDHIKNLIYNYNRRLQLLKEQQALRGLNTPPEIVLEIEDIEAKLKQLRIELNEAEIAPEPTSPVNELKYLHEQLTLFEVSQHSASDPRRFQEKIEELKRVITNWEGRIEGQRQRITDGLEKQRQDIIEKGQPKPGQKLVRVIGRPPLGEVEYFKDRQQERATIGRLLAEPTTRLVSVIGQGGMGKTALTSKILADLERHRWPHTDEDLPLDGIIYLSTRTGGISLERLFLDCAQILGGEAEKKLNAVWTNPKLGTDGKISCLLEALQGGYYVILLDNLEDLLDDRCQLIDQDLRLFFDRSLTTSHGARLLVTSRVTLAFKSEAMRFDRQVKLLDGLPMEDGMDLLRELDPNGDYGLRDAPAEQLAQAVSLVHGVPRALEVLVGILANDPFASLKEVIEQFYEQTDVVQGLIEENYRRLDSNSRRVIEALAVFKRPVPSVAVDYLLEPFFPGLDIPDILRRLTHTNILTIDRATKTVTLHPIDQDYAYSQLPREITDETAYTRQMLERRAADYYVQLRTLPETWKAIDDLAPQLAEFEHRVRAGDYKEACQVLGSVDNDYLYQWGHYARLIEMRGKLLEQLTNPSVQVDNLGGLGRAYYAKGHYSQAIQLYDKALVIVKKAGDQKRTEQILGELGRAYHQLGQIKKASEYYQKALDISREIGDQRAESLWLSFLAWANLAFGEIDAAIKRYEEALSIARSVGTRSEEGRYLGNLGQAYHRLGQIEKATKCYQDALNIVREVGNRRYECFFMGYLGSAYRDLGQTDKAINLHNKSLGLAREIGNRHGEVLELHQLGTAYLAQEKTEEAIEFYNQALAVACEIGDHRRESYNLVGLGRSFLDAGILLEARSDCEKARDLDMPETSYLATVTLGIILLHQHDLAAREVFTEAVARCQVMLNKTANSYEARYALAIALVGQAVCDPRWTGKNTRINLLAPAMAEYRRAMENCDAPGVVQDTLRDLELIRAAGVEGLEPVFELLQNGAKE